MTATYFIRNSSVDYDLQNFQLKKELERSIDTCDVAIVKTDIDNINIGDEPSLIYWDGSTETVKFSGRVGDKDENEAGRIIIESYGAIINNVTAEEIYDDKSPEFIAEDLITNHTDLTYASTASSGITIKRFVVNTDTIGEAIGRLITDLLKDWHIRSDNDKNFFFEPKNTTNSSENITINNNAYLTGTWNRNPDKIVNKITLVGDVQTFSTDQDSFTAVGGETTLTLSFKPKGNIFASKDGVELLGGVDDGTSSPEFTVDRDNSIITWTTSLNANEVMVIKYEYEVPVKITAQNDVSIASFGTRATKVTDKTIRTMDDARIFVQNYLAVNSQEDVGGEFNVDINRDINVGELLPVIDVFNSINTTFLVNSVITVYPSGLKTVKVGRVKFDSLKNQKDMNNRLKKLEQEFDNTDLIQLYREIVEQVNIQLDQTYVTYTRDIDNSWIVGSTTNGIVGTWIGTAGGGQLVVGGTTNTETILQITNNNNNFVYYFDSNAFFDSSSTATLVTGQVEF